MKKSLVSRIVARNAKKSKKCTVIKRNVTEQEIKDIQEKLRKRELEVEERSNKKAHNSKHYNSLEELMLEQGYVGEIHE